MSEQAEADLHCQHASTAGKSRALLTGLSRSDGTLGQIWNNDLPSLPMRQLIQIPLRVFLRTGRVRAQCTV